jgi:hypothetical protein
LQNHHTNYEEAGETPQGTVDGEINPFILDDPPATEPRTSPVDGSTTPLSSSTRSWKTPDVDHVSITLRARRRIFREYSSILKGANRVAIAYDRSLTNRDSVPTLIVGF